MTAKRIEFTTPQAYRLFHEGVIALAKVEAAGIRIDIGYLDSMLRKTRRRIDRLEERLKQDEVFGVWKKEYGHRAKIGSREQLAHILFDVLGNESPKRTKGKKRPSSDEENLLTVDIPFIKLFIENEKLKKLYGTYLKGLRREVEGEFLHPFYNLHTVVTYRGSSDRPNFQNIPIRDPLIAKIIRRCFIPRNGHVLVDIDYSALEFRIAACFWKDPRMVEYASNPRKDIHRDEAAACFLLEKRQVTKEVRYCGKNQFVFPHLYGSYYVNCSRHLWDSINSEKLETVDGVLLKEHLLQQGIKKLGACDPKKKPELGTFERVVQEVEKKFDRRFSVFSGGREKVWSDYVKRGYFKLMTGFVVHGHYTKNQVMNTPVQGPAFHCLLWSLIRIVKTLRKKRMKAKVIAHIHDSILADVPENEVEDYIAIATQLLTIEIRKAWKWLIVPLEAEIEIAEENWYSKRKVEFSSGL